MPTHSGAEPLPKIEKLNAGNHLAWFANMEHMLKHKNCWTAVKEEPPLRVARILQEEAPIPSRAELDVIVAGTPTTEAGKVAKSKARAQLGTLDWQRLDEVAMATMHLCVEPVHHVTFRVSKTAREAWEKLPMAFRSQSMAMALEMRRQLSGIRMKAEEPMLENINRGTLLQYELGQLGQGPPESDLVAAILGGVPSAYDTTVELLAGQETLTMAKVTYRLMAAEVRHKALYGSGSDKAVAFGAMPFTTASAHPNNRREAEVCTYCRYPGHGRWECRRLARDQEPSLGGDQRFGGYPQQQPTAGNRPRGSRGGNQSRAHRPFFGNDDRGSNERGGGAPPGGGLAMMAGTSMPFKDGWIMDSGASHHMTGKMSLLSDVHDIEPVTITMANGEDSVANLSRHCHHRHCLLRWGRRPSEPTRRAGAGTPVRQPLLHYCHHAARVRGDFWSGCRGHHSKWAKRLLWAVPRVSVRPAHCAGGHNGHGGCCRLCWDLAPTL